MRMSKNCSVWYHEACLGLIKVNDLDYLCSSCKRKLFLFKYSRRKWCFINFYREFNGWALLSTLYAIRPTNNFFLKKEKLCYYFFIYMFYAVMLRK
jgi:hypothetical protein